MEYIIDIIQLIGGVILTVGYLPQIKQIIKTKSVKDFNLNYLLSIAIGVGCMEVYAVYQFSKGLATAFFITNTISTLLAVIMLCLNLKYREVEIDVKRFQECNFFVRLYRRIKYQPISFIKALWASVLALLTHGSETARLVYIVRYSDWYSKAHWYYTTEEVIDNLIRQIEREDIHG